MSDESGPRFGATARRPAADLLTARGPSGYEQAPAAVFREAAAPFAEVSTDTVGSPLARVAREHGVEPSARRLLVMGHIDEIGLIVTTSTTTASCGSAASAAGTRRSSSASAS